MAVGAGKITYRWALRYLDKRDENSSSLLITSSPAFQHLE